MRNILKIISLTLMVLCFSNFNELLAQNKELNKTKNGFYEKIDSIVVSKMSQYSIPGIAIGVVKNNSIVYTKGYGVKKLGSSDLVNEHAVFHTASVSKLFTAMAIIQLVEQKKITLDDRVVDVLQDLNYSDENVKKITIKHLLNHTSGLPDINNYHWKNNHQSERSLQEYILKLKLKVSTEPSLAYHYSNLGYDILGYIIEKASGITFEDYVQKHILNPSEMMDSDFRYFKIKESLKTAPHTKRWIGRNIYVRKTYPYTREHAPSSTLNASAQDLSKWMVFFLEKLTDENSTDLYNTMLKPSFGAKSTIGLGFQLYAFDSYKAVGHFGGDKGFRSFLMMIPSEGIGVVVLGNCDYEEDYRQEIVNPIVKLMLAK